MEVLRSVTALVEAGEYRRGVPRRRRRAAPARAAEHDRCRHPGAGARAVLDHLLGRDRGDEVRREAVLQPRQAGRCLLVPRAATVDFLRALPVGALWGVGERNRGVPGPMGDPHGGRAGGLRRGDGPAGGRRAAGAHLHDLAWGATPGRCDRAGGEVDRGRVTFGADVRDPVWSRRGSRARRRRARPGCERAGSSDARWRARCGPATSGRSPGRARSTRRPIRQEVFLWLARCWRRWTSAGCPCAWSVRAGRGAHAGGRHGAAAHAGGSDRRTAERAGGSGARDDGVRARFGRSAIAPAAALTAGNADRIDYHRWLRSIYPECY